MKHTVKELFLLRIASTMLTLIRKTFVKLQVHSTSANKTMLIVTHCSQTDVTEAEKTKFFLND